MPYPGRLVKGKIHFDALFFGRGRIFRNGPACGGARGSGWRAKPHRIRRAFASENHMRPLPRRARLSTGTPRPHTRSRALCHAPSSPIRGSKGAALPWPPEATACMPPRTIRPGPRAPHHHPALPARRAPPSPLIPPPLYTPEPPRSPLSNFRHAIPQRPAPSRCARR
ncbi:hypothetical protein GGQ74_002000 [Desulfobaculum xiamenense]|uniref:Uncharacterized protein n=1 Tax=Desulfobaculum xiamenense TaxID=995050 RepID=A0A846QMB3_9BACT|nr:hypothetical protein [Desulfobaculum xiamenense]